MYTRTLSCAHRARTVSWDGYWPCAIRTYLTEVKSSGYTARDRYKVCFIDYAPPSAPWVADRVTSAPDGISSNPYIYIHTHHPPTHTNTRTRNHAPPRHHPHTHIHPAHIPLTPFSQPSTRYITFGH